MQVRSQKFFREGELSWNQGMKSRREITGKKSVQKTLSIFSPRLSGNYTLNKKFNPMIGTIRTFFSKIRVLFSVLEIIMSGFSPFPRFGPGTMAEYSSISLNIRKCA